MHARRSHPLAALLLGISLVAGCSAATVSGTGDGAEATGTSSTTTTADGSSGTASGTPASAATALADTHDDASDYEWDAPSEVAIVLRDGGSTGGAGVSITGNLVTITNGGTYRLRGTLSDGQVVVATESEEVVRLVLDGVDISSSTTSPLSVVEAAKVVVILAAGSENKLADAAAYQLASADVDEPNAALFSSADLTIAGEGSLAVTGSYNDGIASKDGLIIAGSTVTVEAVDDGIRGKDYLVVTGGTLAVTAGGDALKADNEEDAGLGYVAIAGGTLDLTAGMDGIDAFTAATVRDGDLVIAAGDDAIHSETLVEVDGGTIDVTRSYEGLEGTRILITNGLISIVAEDDGLNVAGGVDGSGWTQEGGLGVGPGGRGAPGGGPGGETAIEGYYVEMSGGTIVIDAGGDGFDSNGSATVTGGTIVVNGPTTNGNGAIDVNGEFLISDTILVAAGSLGMAETPSTSSAQGTLHLAFDSLVTAGTVVRVQASDGTNIATFVGSKPLQSLVVSTPGVEAGAAYEVLTGGSVDGTSLGGLYLDPDYTPGTVIGTVTAITS